MARKTKTSPKTKPGPKPKEKPGLLKRLRRAVLRLILLLVLAVLGLTLAYRFVNPPMTLTIWAAYRDLGSYKQSWVPLEEVAEIAPAALVAAEDANFCKHVGFDIDAIRMVIAEGARRGASTISQQTAKNVFLWQERGWARKALEAGFTLLIELFWPKARILEVYMNVAEFDEGVFGIKAAAQHYFGVEPARLSGSQAAALAAVLPNPKARSASSPGPRLRARAASILSGARTIAADGRDACFTPTP